MNTLFLIPPQQLSRLEKEKYYQEEQDRYMFSGNFGGYVFFKYNHVKDVTMSKFLLFSDIVYDLDNNAMVKSRFGTSKLQLSTELFELFSSIESIKNKISFDLLKKQKFYKRSVFSYAMYLIGGFNSFKTDIDYLEYCSYCYKNGINIGNILNDIEENYPELII